MAEAEALLDVPYNGEPRRARVCLDFMEGDERVRAVETGWACIEGLWLHWWADENEGYWQTWPPQNVQWIAWLDDV
jgi:hypothetical protein